MTEIDNADEKNTPDAPQSVGVLLKHARINAGFTTTDVATKLNLRVALIEEIERDEFASIAAPTYVRGYLLNFAQFVDVDAQLIHASLAKHVSMPDVHLQSFSRKTTRQARDHRWRMVTYVLASSLLLMTGAWWLQDRDKPEYRDFSEKTVEEMNADQESMQVRVATHTVKQEKIDVWVNHAGWVEIQDKEGGYLIQGYQKAQTKLELNGQPPFTVMLSAPEHVTLSYQGQAIDLSSYPSGQVVRFQLPH